MKILYQASAVATGGRDGQVSVENTPLRFEMASPPELGGSKPEGYNPEQLFAAGYAACFGSALQHVFKVNRLCVGLPQVHATVGIGRNDAGGFALAVELVAVFKDLDQATADQLVLKAHQICPYSNATRGNIEVKVSARVE